MQNDREEILVTVDSFLGALGLRAEEKRIRSTDQRDALYRMIGQYAVERDLIVAPAGHVQPDYELPMRIPGTAYHIRVGKPEKGEVGVLTGLALGLMTAGHIHPDFITLGVVAGVLSRIRKLRPQFGERSVVDAVMELERATVRNVALHLHGLPCRYPDAGCRFRSGPQGPCGITEDQAGELIRHLESKVILRQVSPVDPPEYKVTV